MQIDRHVELFGTLQDRPIEFVVEIAAAIVAVDDRAFEACANSALQLRGGFFRRCRRQRGKPGKALGIFLHGVGKEVVGLSRHRDGFVLRALLGPRILQRQDLHIDAGGVHLRQPLGADVGKAVEEVRVAAAGLLRPLLEVAAGAVEKSGTGEMFLERNGSHGRSLSCRCVSLCRAVRGRNSGNRRAKGGASVLILKSVSFYAFAARVRWQKRWMLARMSLAVLVQRKGLGSALVASM